MKNLRLFTALMFCALMGVIASTVFGNPVVGYAVFFGLTLAGTQVKTGVVGMATPDTSALAAYAGKYEQKLFSTLRQSLSMLNDLEVVPGIKNILKLTKLTVKDGVRGYREQFDSADEDLAYSGRDLSVELLKRDFTINPLKYRNTWMIQVMKPGVNPDDIPFAQFVNAAIMQQIAQEVQKGAYLAAKTDSLTLAKSFNGLGTLIAAAITAETGTAGTGLVPVATGAITNVNAVSKFETMVAAMPVEYVQQGFEIKASIDSVRKYQQDYRERYGKYKEKNELGFLEVDDAAGMVTIKPCTWMGTSSRLIASPKENLLVGVDALGDMDKIHTDVELEILRYRVLFALGFQIRDLGAIKVNDQA